MESENRDFPDLSAIESGIADREADETQQAKAEFDELLKFHSNISMENRKIEDLNKREAALQQKDQDLNAQESKIVSMESEIASLESEVGQQLEEGQHSTDLYVESYDMPQETPDFKIKFVSLLFSLVYIYIL